jgi:hypothetical protein
MSGKPCRKPRLHGNLPHEVFRQAPADISPAPGASDPQGRPAVRSALLDPQVALAVLCPKSSENLAEGEMITVPHETLLGLVGRRPGALSRLPGLLFGKSENYASDAHRESVPVLPRAPEVVVARPDLGRPLYQAPSMRARPPARQAIFSRLGARQFSFDTHDARLPLL